MKLAKKIICPAISAGSIGSTHAYAVIGGGPGAIHTVAPAFITISVSVS